MDPLLPEPGPLPEAVGDDLVLDAAGAVGLVRRVVLDEAALAAAWYALDQRWLSAQVTSPAAMAGLLGRWREHLAGEPAPDPDSAAIVMWPSRDMDMTPVFLAHGLVPTMVIAVRPAARPGPAVSSTVPVRRAGPADLDAVVALSLEEVRFSARISGIPQRPNTAELMRNRYATALAEDEPLVWVADRDSKVIGVVSVAVAEQAAWIAPLVAASPVAYVDCAAVAPADRGGGVAAALIQQVHHAMDAAAIAVTMLHYGALNPLSAPFWHRSGYRPLRTRWQTSPVR
jgi:ribosomal protein S18 acetylase RimI-like enzyme